MSQKRFLRGTNVLPMTATFPDHPVLVFDDDRLIEISDQKDIDPVHIEEYNGTLIPGFVNAHCHLELSHMKGVIESGTGLTPFLHAVVTQDPVAEDVILNAINQADQEMWESGIVAVGDISNLPYTADAKAGSPILYYTFVEMFDFLDTGKANYFYGQYESVYQTFRRHGLKHVTQVPHSPYTVSRKLMKMLSKSLSSDATGTIHMLENEQEDYLMMGGSSEYYDFFKGLDLNLDHFQPPGHGSLKEFLETGYRPATMLFVHNTVADAVDLELISQYNVTTDAYLVTCPNANLYIESRLPDYELWRRSGLPICIGTDSYASNHQLSIWDEICTIKSHNPNLSWDELLRWGTWNGAVGLGMDAHLGSFEVGKSPGVVLLDHRDGEPINFDSIPRKLV